MEPIVLIWTKQSNGDWLGKAQADGPDLYRIPANKSRHYHLHWATDDEKLSDRAASLADQKELAQQHFDSCVLAGMAGAGDGETVETPMEETTSPVPTSPPTEMIESMEKQADELEAKPDTPIAELETVSTITEFIPVEISPAYEPRSAVPSVELEETTNPVAAPETVDAVLSEQEIHQAADKVDEALDELEKVVQDATAEAAIERRAEAEAAEEELPEAETPTLLWNSTPVPQRNETSLWIQWFDVYGRFRVYAAHDLFGGEHYFGASFRKPLKSGEMLGTWDSCEYNKAGFVRYKELSEALEAAARKYRELTGHSEADSNAEDVTAYAGAHGLLKLPESGQKVKKSLSFGATEADNNPKGKTRTTQPKGETTMKMKEQDARNMCVAIGWKSAADADKWPLPKLQMRINDQLVANLDDLDAPTEKDDLRNFKAVVKTLQEGGKVVVIAGELDEGSPETDEETPKKKRGRPAAENTEEAPAKKKATAKAASGGNGNRVDLFGHSVTSVVRWMGKSGWSFEAARKALDNLGASCADATLKIQLAAGAKGQRGDPAELSGAQQKELKTAAKE